MQPAANREPKPSPAAQSDPAKDASAAADAPALPAFLQRRAEGLFVNTKALDGEGCFAEFVASRFGDGWYFDGLDYAAFQDLLFEAWSRPAGDKPMRLAADIRPFAPCRRNLYKGFAQGDEGHSSLYMFEPVFLEPEEPPGATGSAASRMARSQPEPAALDFGEFVAHAWGHGIRFGMDASRVLQAIESGERGKVQVARWREPVPGKDADMEEKCASLHRDDSPMMNADGQVDLSQFKNRFPQVSAGEPLFRKVPRKPGVPGRRLNGEAVDCGIPKDFDMALLAGPGTRFENREDGEYIVADITGFIEIDKTSNRVAVNEKMVGREGVSMRTTGNLRLTGAEYEEHGEVDAKRVIEGHDMSFKANVYGILVSDGGLITICQNLINGTVRNPAGKIESLGLASASTLEAPGGVVRMKRAEGCMIWADRVEIEHAVCCEIIAAEVVLGNAEGCNIITQGAQIAVSGSYKGRENALTLLIPMQREDKARREEAEKHLLLVQKRIDKVNAEKGELEAKKEFSEFLKLQSGIARGLVKLSAAHADAFRQLHSRMQPTSQRYTALLQALEKLTAELDQTRGLITSLQNQTAHTRPIHCGVALINGDTVVQSLQCFHSEDGREKNGLAQMRAWIHGNNQTPVRLYASDSGAFTWSRQTEDAARADEAGMALAA